MSIKILKLTNGDDVITDIGDGDPVTMDNPARLMMFPDPNSGGMGMALVPWCPYTSEQQFTIASIHVITTIEEKEIHEDLVREYREKFGSGLVTPPEKKIQTDLIL